MAIRGAEAATDERGRGDVDQDNSCQAFGHKILFLTCAMAFGKGGILSDRGRETCWTGYLSLWMILQSGSVGGSVTDNTPLPREAKCKDKTCPCIALCVKLFRKWNILEMPTVSALIFFQVQPF